MGHCIPGNWDYAKRVVKETNNNVRLELTGRTGEHDLIEILVEAVSAAGGILFATDLPWFEEYQRSAFCQASGH